MKYTLKKTRLMGVVGLYVHFHVRGYKTQMVLIGISLY